MAETNALPAHWPADGCCANCSAALTGDWCHACGQRADDHHRSLRHFLAEAAESLTEADSRLWRTVRRLVRHPALLTKDYLAGRRARYIPPLRLFVVALVALFAAGTLLHAGRIPDNSSSPPAEVHKTLSQIDLFHNKPLSQWVQRHIEKAVAEPNEVVRTMREYGEKFAFLMLPVTALSLKLLFLFRKNSKLYDHVIFSLHALSYLAFAFALVFALDHVPWARRNASLLLLTAPVHLFVHLRGVYGGSVFGTLVRMWFLFLFTASGALVLLTALSLLAVGLMPA